MKKKIILFIVSVLMFSACDDLFEPAIENFQGVEHMYSDAEYARGILHNVYSLIPGYYDNSEYGTDDAVTNQPTNVFLQMATGAWTTSSYNPLNQWTNSFGAIQYINLFLKNVDGVKWSDDEETNKLFAQRLIGEAYGLRGMFYYYLLRAHAGIGENGELLGIPILKEFQTVESDFNQPRASFQACIEQIHSDLSEAEKRLPFEYEDVTGNTVPVDFQNITKNVGKYNTVMGSKARQLFNGIVARAYWARTSILAASPIFQAPSNTVTWADAANAAAAVIDYKRGISGIAADGLEYYSANIVNSVANGTNPNEILWRGNKGSGDNDQESQNFPPSLYGNGNMNPSQNLVDAFPMANGYPINDEASKYDTNNPYAGRDPRLGKYIFYNGSTISEKSITLNINAGNQDGVNITENRSTRTGYYMKKRLRMDVNCDPANTSKQPHYIPRIRYTEMFLDYAEAANEAWGPKDGNGRNYSAYDVIKAIRKRAGIGGTDDSYLETCATNKDKMRELIRNERRLELCFEGFRFWDLRRWKAGLNETVYGVNWDGSSYQKVSVEERSYEDYMYNCPIPNSEMLKYNNLIQNKGWK